VRRSTFAQAAIGAGAAALNRVFSDYPIPLTFSSEQLHLHMSYNDVVASASPLWYDDNGAFLAAALLGIRGRRGWIGGFGVSPEYRGRGIAAELMNFVADTGREHGLQSIALEVLVDNAPAVRTYTAAGFRIERKLYSFEAIREDVPAVLGFASVPPQDLIDEPDAVRQCWQRERATLRNGAVSTAVLDTRGNFALFRFNADLAQVLKVHAGSPEELTLVANAIAAGRPFQSVMILNEPEDSPITAFARASNWDQPFVQYEMVLSL
jgi:ribosomal protein S18 acetylase RimI-like enzyme